MDERAGPWILGPVIASGELSEIRVGRDGDRRVAVKRLHSHASRRPEVSALFATEATLTCALPPHPRLVRGLDHGGDDAHRYLALGYVDGGDLRAQLGVAHPRATVAAVVVAVAHALEHLHGQGWVHGDVVPANVLVATTGPVLCDLGVARPVDGDGPVRGTAAYMAPEQVRGQRWTPAVDLFALGVIAWELAAGARLFHRGPSFLSMAAIVETVAPPLTDPALAPVVAAMLSPDPTARPTSAEVIERLEPLRA